MNTTKIPSYIFTVKATNEQVKVRTEYPEDVSIITHNNLISQETWADIAYPHVDHAMIEIALHNESAQKLVLHNDFWETQKKYGASHQAIIARLVNSIKINGCYPLQYDTFSRDHSHIDGHHRLIALRFLNRNKDDFLIPINLSGLVDELEQLFSTLDCEFKPC